MPGEVFASLTAELVGDITPLRRHLNQARGELDRFATSSQMAGATAGTGLGRGFVARAAGALSRAEGPLGRALVLPFRAVGVAASAAWAATPFVAGGAAVAGLGLATREAMGLENAMVNIRKASGLDEASIVAVEEGIKAMATDASLAGVKLDDLLKIADVGAKLGIAEQGPQALLDYTRALGMASLAIDDLPVEAVAEWSGQILNTFGESSAKTLHFTSVLDYLADSTTASAGGIADVTQRMSGMAATAGLTIPQTAALATAVLDMGNRSEMSGSALQRIIALMLTEPAGFAQAVGMTVGEFTRLRDANPFEALRLTTAALAEMEGGARLAGLEELGVKGVYAQQVMLGLAQRVQELAPLAEGANAEWQTGAHVLESVALNVQKTSSQMQLLMNQAAVAGDELGKAFLGPLKELGPILVQAGKDLAQFFIENRGEIQAFASDLLSVARGIQGVGTAARAAFGTVMQPVRDLRGVVTAVQEDLGLGLTGASAAAAAARAEAPLPSFAEYRESQAQQLARAGGAGLPVSPQLGLMDPTDPLGTRSRLAARRPEPIGPRPSEIRLDDPMTALAEAARTGGIDPTFAGGAAAADTGERWGEFVDAAMMGADPERLADAIAGGAEGIRDFLDFQAIQDEALAASGAAVPTRAGFGRETMLEGPALERPAPAQFVGLEQFAQQAAVAALSGQRDPLLSEAQTHTQLFQQQNQKLDVLIQKGGNGLTLT